MTIEQKLRLRAKCAAIGTLVSVMLIIALFTCKIIGPKSIYLLGFLLVFSCVNVLVMLYVRLILTRI